MPGSSYGFNGPVTTSRTSVNPGCGFTTTPSRHKHDGEFNDHSSVAFESVRVDRANVMKRIEFEAPHG
jgi:hypothetical protein